MNTALSRTTLMTSIATTLLTLACTGRPVVAAEPGLPDDTTVSFSRSAPWSLVERTDDDRPLDLKEFVKLDVSFAAFQADDVEAILEEEDRLNRVGLFLGATSKGSHIDFTMGIEYERRFTDLIGVGAIGEWTPGNGDFIGAIPVYFHPFEGLFLSIGPGFSAESGGTYFLVRLGAGWYFDLPDGWSLAPEISYDIIDSSQDALVVGLSLNYAF